MKIASILNSGIVMMLALFVGAWSFWANPADVASSSQEWSLDGGVFDEEIQSTTLVTYVRNGRDALTLMPDSVATVQWDEATHHMDVLLTSGGVLFATQANDFTVSVHTSTARVDSQESTAYVERNEDGLVTVYGLSHPSLITFTLSGEELNSLFVPDGMMIEVSEAKVTSTLKRLRLTKLSKEFKAKEWDDEDFNEVLAASWSDSKLRYTTQSVTYAQALQSDLHFGPAQNGIGASIDNLYNKFRDLATVLPSAEVRLKESRKNNMLTYAMTNLLFGEVSKGEAWVVEWKAESHELDEIESLYSDLFFVLPGDELYPIKTAVIDLAFDQDATLNSLRRQFLEIESLVARGESVEAQSALNEYQTTVSQALESGAFDDPAMGAALGREYLLVERLLRENADFYNVDYASLLTDMEVKILALAGDDTDLHEERQAFVLSKIQFLNKLFEFVVDRRVSIDEATDLANELLITAEGYMALIPSDVAVREYYESELDQADLAISFINSPEFYSYSDFDEGLEAYAAKEKDLEDLQAYIQEIRSGNGDIVANLTLDEAVEEVRSTMTYHAISYVTAESQGDAAYRLFDIIGGKVDQYSFEASYDREGHLFYDLVIEDQIRFSTGILVSDLREVIEQALTETPLEEDSDDDLVATDSSLTDSLAITQVESAFEEASFKLEDFDFEIVDRDAGLFSFKGVITKYEIPVQGTYDLNSAKVLDVTWDLNGVPQTLPDMALSQMEAAVKAVYEALSRA